MNKMGRILSVILMLILGIGLLYFAFQPPKSFVLLHGHVERIGCGLIGVFFVLVSVMNVFYKEK